MTNNICIIDDGFSAPAISLNVEHHTQFCGATLQHFTSLEGWVEDRSLKNLCTTLLESEENSKKHWHLSGFTHPQLYHDAFAEQNYRSDIIIYDWEYGSAEFDQADDLKNIFKKSHVHVFIYSGADKIAEIKNIIEDDLKEFKDRINLRDKGDPDDSSHEELHGYLLEKQKENFGFKFGQTLRKVTNSSLDHVLRHLSDLDIRKVNSYLGGDQITAASADSSETIIDTDTKELIGEKIKNHLKESAELQQLLKEHGMDQNASLGLIEFIAEKTKVDIISRKLTYTADDQATEPDSEDEILNDLWSYRMYHKPNDDIVRTGDIVKKGSDFGLLYLVLTAPCDLNKFWSSNGGRLVVVELLDILKNKNIINEIAKLSRNINSNFKNRIGTISSLTNIANLDTISGNPLLIPLVPINENANFSDYLLFPDRIQNIYIEMPTSLSRESETIRKGASLEYNHFDYHRVCTVSDPFSGPLLGCVINNLFGWGVPDYGDTLKNNLADKVKAIFQPSENSQ